MRLRRSLARRGALGTLRLAAWHAGEPARAVILAVQEWRFDMQHGVYTRGTRRMRDSSIHADSYKYAAASPARFQDLLGGLPADPRALTFVDVGCGRGKTFVLAAQAGFRRLVGVELSSELAAVARSNLIASGIVAEIVEGDAALFVFPDEPLFVFLFNPFGEATLQAMLDRIRLSLARSRRLVFLAYQNPIHHDRIVASGFLPVASGKQWELFAAAQPSDRDDEVVNDTGSDV